MILCRGRGRYVDDDVDLDLTYITEKIIGMRVCVCVHTVCVCSVICSVVVGILITNSLHI